MGDIVGKDSQKVQAGLTSVCPCFWGNRFERRLYSEWTLRG